jgi:hypothetical protein
VAPAAFASDMARLPATRTSSPATYVCSPTVRDATSRRSPGHDIELITLVGEIDLTRSVELLAAVQAYLESRSVDAAVEMSEVPLLWAARDRVSCWVGSGRTDEDRER